MTELCIHASSWSDGQNDLKKIRQEVFIDEQGVTPEDEWDAEDATCTHFLVRISEEPEPIACARLLADGHIGRVAVRRPWRGQGVGQRLIRYILDYAADNGQLELELDAQTQALEFYRRLGFAAEGPDFMDAGIPHRKMRIRLPDRHQPLDFAAPEGSFSIQKEAEPERYKTRAGRIELPPGGVQQHLDSLDAITRSLIEQLDQSGRRCWIYSQNLDHRLFEQPELIEALSRFARRNANTELKILLADTRSIAQRGHALVRLRQRLPSLIDVRRTSADTVLPAAELLLFDQDSWLEVHAFAPAEAGLFRGCPVQQLDLAEHFINAWELASEPTELRSLKL